MDCKNKVFQLTPDERQELINRLSAFLAKEENILFAYLHGSFHEGGPFRDLDIAVYLVDLPSREQFAFELKLEDRLEREFRYPADLKVLNNAPPSFAYMVIKKGLKLYVRNDSERVAFEVGTFKKYFDFLPFRKRYLEEVIDA